MFGDANRIFRIPKALDCSKFIDEIAAVSIVSPTLRKNSESLSNETKENNFVSPSVFLSKTIHYFTPISKTVPARPCHELRRNWSADELCRIKRGRIGKIRTQDTLDRQEKLRKIKTTNNRSAENDDYSSCGSNQLEEWFDSIRKHQLCWEKEAVKGLYRPSMSALYEDDEFVLEPAENFTDEEECF